MHAHKLNHIHKRPLFIPVCSNQSRPLNHVLTLGRAANRTHADVRLRGAIVLDVQVEDSPFNPQKLRQTLAHIHEVSSADNDNKVHEYL
jgi:hypothetical protein